MEITSLKLKTIDVAQVVRNFDYSRESVAEPKIQLKLSPTILISST